MLKFLLALIHPSNGSPRIYDLKSFITILKENFLKKGYKVITFLILKNMFNMACTVVFLPIAGTFYFLGYQFIAGTKFKQLGEAFLIHVANSDIQKRKRKLIYLDFPIKVDNRRLLESVLDDVVVFKNIFMILLLSPIANVCFLRVNVNLYNVTKKKRARSVQACVDSAKKIEFKFSDDELNAFNQELSINGLGKRPLVLLHVRDENYYREKFCSLRNAKFESYYLGIEWLLGEGFDVVRFGTSESMGKVDHGNVFQLKGDGSGVFFDYTKSEFNDRVFDLLLLNYATYYVFCSSGPAEIPNMLKKNVLLVNAYPPKNCFRFCDGDLSIFKKFKQNDKLLSLEEHFSEPFDVSLSMSMLEQNGYTVEDNSAEEILLAIKDYITGDSVLADFVDDKFREFQPWLKSGRGCLAKSFINNSFSR